MIINILHNHSCYPIKHITLEHWAMVFSLSQPFHDLEELQKDLIQTHWIVSYKALVFDKWKFSIATCVIVWQDYASYWEYLRINMFLLLFLHTIFGISWSYKYCLLWLYKQVALCQVEYFLFIMIFERLISDVWKVSQSVKFISKTYSSIITTTLFWKYLYYLFGKMSAF